MATQWEKLQDRYLGKGAHKKPVQDRLYMAGRNMGTAMGYGNPAFLPAMAVGEVARRDAEDYMARRKKAGPADLNESQRYALGGMGGAYAAKEALAPPPEAPAAEPKTPHRESVEQYAWGGLGGSYAAREALQRHGERAAPDLSLRPVGKFFNLDSSGLMKTDEEVFKARAAAPADDGMAVENYVKRDYEGTGKIGPRPPYQNEFQQKPPETSTAGFVNKEPAPPGPAPADYAAIGDEAIAAARTRDAATQTRTAQQSQRKQSAYERLFGMNERQRHDANMDLMRNPKTAAAGGAPLDGQLRARSTRGPSKKARQRAMEDVDMRLKIAQAEAYNARADAARAPGKAPEPKLPTPMAALKASGDATTARGIDAIWNSQGVQENLAPAEQAAFAKYYAEYEKSGVLSPDGQVLFKKAGMPYKLIEQAAEEDKGPGWLARQWAKLTGSNKE